MPLKIRNVSTSTIAAGTVALVLLGASLVVASTQSGQPATQERQAQEREEEMGLGTYEAQLVFQGSRYGQTLNERMRQFQQQFQQAHQEGDQQRAAQIQQQMEAAQNETVQEFLTELEKVMPDVVAGTNIKVVALEVVYIDPEFEEPKDLTQELIAQLSEGGEGEQEPERSPFSPPQGQ